MNSTEHTRSRSVYTPTTRQLTLHCTCGEEWTLPRAAAEAALAHHVDRHSGRHRPATGTRHAVDGTLTTRCACGWHWRGPDSHAAAALAEHLTEYSATSATPAPTTTVPAWRLR